MKRTVEPELLDSLDPAHPDAVHNRRDLRLTNVLMRSFAWFESVLPSRVRHGDRVLEIGAGTGELAQRLHRLGVAVDGLDLWPAPRGWPSNQAWHRCDVRAFTGWADYTVVIGNLIFHQFTAGELQQVGRAVSRARLVVASEPLRRRLSQFLYRTAAPLFGANHVSLHDARVSIAAGFRDDELPRALGLSDGWTWRCRNTWLGACRTIACRAA